MSLALGFRPRYMRRRPSATIAPQWIDGPYLASPARSARTSRTLAPRNPHQPPTYPIKADRPLQGPPRRRRGHSPPPVREPAAPDATTRRRCGPTVHIALTEPGPTTLFHRRRSPRPAVREILSRQRPDGPQTTWQAADSPYGLDCATSPRNTCGSPTGRRGGGRRACDPPPRPMSSGGSACAERSDPFGGLTTAYVGAYASVDRTLHSQYSGLPIYLLRSWSGSLLYSARWMSHVDLRSAARARAVSWCLRPTTVVLKRNGSHVARSRVRTAPSALSSLTVRA